MFKDINEEERQAWISRVLENIPEGHRLLDAGAGELKNKKHCSHLEYVSQDICAYSGGYGNNTEGLHTGEWNTRSIDIVCDITSIPEDDNSFDVILCSEVLEHVPDPVQVLCEFSRLLRSGGKLILTAPFSSLVHMAPYHYCSGFSQYWYEYHLPKKGFVIEELSKNGDWYSVLGQEMKRIGSIERKNKSWMWPVGYFVGAIGVLYIKIRAKNPDSNLASFGWHCMAEKT